MSGLTNDNRAIHVGYILAIVSSFGAGLATVLGKWNLLAISPLLMNCIIFSTATVALSLFWVPFRGLRGTFCHSARGWFWLLLFAATSFVAIWAFWAGVKRMDPSLAAFLNRIEVPIVIALGVIFLKERFGKIEIMGAVLSIIGIIIMKLTLRFEYNAGFWYVLLGSVFFGITEFVSKVALKYIDAVPMAYLRNMLMAAGYWIILFGTGASFEGLGKVWYGVLALGLVGPILSRLLYMLALKRMELSKVAIISQLQPVFVLMIALVAFHQLPGIREIWGGVFLLIGCLVMIWGRTRPLRQGRLKVVKDEQS